MLIPGLGDNLTGAFFILQEDKNLQAFAVGQSETSHCSLAIETQGLSSSMIEYIGDVLYVRNI